MMKYVTDTHALWWFLHKDKKLGNEAKQIFEDSELGNSIIIIPSIVLAELMYLFEKEKRGDEFKEILEGINIASNYEICPLDIQIIEEVSNITSIKEIHDRIIIATAKLLNYKLITKDENIAESKEVKCVW